jgi:hypothetical protein
MHQARSTTLLQSCSMSEKWRYEQKLNELQTEQNVNEVIRIIRCVKKHLEESPTCSHSLRDIVKEALKNEA